MISRVSAANDLKDSLDVSAQRTREIASRIAQSQVNGGNGFALPSDPLTGQPVAGTDQEDIEKDMASLADEQVRYEATAKLLEKTYEQLRSSVSSQS
ncbi:MAG TPA: hypothetical protein VMH39_17450 [Gemmatimonadaceae bacterium]|nr:hypothetical protein [Gemmatimonadaceae bacterium]